MDKDCTCDFDGKGGTIGQHDFLFGHTADLFQVQDHPPPHPEEAFVQLGLELTKRPLDGVILPGMNRDVILVHVQIPHLIQRQFDLLLLDVEMPGTDGVTLAKTVRQENEAVNCNKKKRLT